MLSQRTISNRPIRARSANTASQAKRAWRALLERACLGRSRHRYQGDGNQVAVDAIDRIMLPTR